MNESALSNDPGTQKRRSTRIVQAVPLTVTGVDALGQPFKERTTTVMVNIHGCKYQSKHYVPKNSIVTLDIPRPEAGLPAHSIQGRVVWVQRPRTVRELFQIGLEFEVPGNVWGIAFPPDDWVASMAEANKEASVVSDLIAELETSSEASSAGPLTPPTPAPPPAPAATAVPAIPVAPVSLAAPVAAPAPPASSPAAPVDNKIHVVTAPAPDPQVAIARHMAKMVTEAKENLDKSLRKGAETAIAEEMTIVRQQLDVQLHDAVEKAIKVSMERVSESSVKKVVQEAAQRTAAIVEEARKATEVSVEQLDAKVRSAVQEAVSTAAEQAAQQAAHHATTQNLKNAVEEAVERAISTRQAASPSIDILSSPEAAQKHLDDWRRSLEDTAQNVRSQTVEQANAEVAEVNRRWQETFDSALAGASQKLGAQLNDASNAALEQAQQVIDEKKSSIQTSMDEVVARAQSSVASLKAGLEQERARTEEAKSQLEEAARATVEATRANLERERARAEEAKSQLEAATHTAVERTQQQLDVILSAKYEEIGRKADQAIAERSVQIAPTLEAAAQRVVERLSGELDRSLASKVSDAHGVISQLSDAEERAAETQTGLIEQIQQISEHAEQLKNAARGHVQEVSDHAAKIQGSLQEQAQQVAEQTAQFQTSVAEHFEQISEHATQVQDTVRESARKASGGSDSGIA